jgi:hypothetical protein
MRGRLFCQAVFMRKPIIARESAKNARRSGLSVGTFETTATSAVAVLLLAGSELMLARGQRPRHPEDENQYCKTAETRHGLVSFCCLPSLCGARCYIKVVCARKADRRRYRPIVCRRCRVGTRRSTPRRQSATHLHAKARRESWSLELEHGGRRQHSSEESQ